MKKKSILHIVFLIMYYAKSSFAQYIQGVVVDKATQRALSGASVRLGSKGLISNNKGEFRINLPKSLGKFTPLKVSYIGYKSIELFPSISKDYYVIEMEEIPSSLSEVVVSSSARGIVDEAFRKIESNYLQREFSTKGFLSESNRFDKNRYIYAIEAFLKTNTKSYGTNKAPDIEILQKKEHLYANLDTLRFVRWGGTPRLLDYYDFVHTKNAIINPDKNKGYRYQLQDIKPFDNRDTYIITFESKNKKKKGKLFIDYQSLAFVGAEYKSTDEPDSTDTHTRDVEVKIMYQESNNKWFLDYINYNGVFNHKNLLSNTGIKSELHLDYKSTEIDTSTTQKIDYSTNIQRKDILLESKVTYETIFWKNHDKKEGSIDLDFEKFLLKQDSLNTFAPKVLSKNTPMAWKHRLIKYIRKNVRIEYSIGSLPLGVIDDNVQFHYTEPNNLFDIDQSKKVKPFNKYGLFWGVAFAMPYKTSFIYQTGGNIPFSGISQDYTAFTILKHFQTAIKQREFSVSPMLGAEFLKLSASFDDINIPSESMKMYGLEGNNICPSLIKKYTNLSTGLRFSYELSRRKRIFLNVKYSQELSVKNQINLKETEGFFLFRNSHTINLLPQESIIKNQTYPFTFQIGLIF